MNKSKNIGLYFGSFNPIHIGHLIIAEFFVENTSLDELWFVLSPQNPFKKTTNLLKDNHRLSMLRVATEDDKRFKICDAELKLPKPSYTINTLAYLSDEYPENKWVLLMGSDNLLNFHKWKNYEEILKLSNIFVYPRPDYPIENCPFKERVSVFNAPLIQISSSDIRKGIQQKKSIKYSVHHKVYKYMREMHFYEK